MQGNKSDESANEHRFLGRLRTGIGYIVFGAVVAKFPLFANRISMISGKDYSLPKPDDYAIMGIAFVVVGTIIAILSYLFYKFSEKHIRDEHYAPASIFSSFLTVFFFIISIFLISYPTQITL